MSGSGGTGGAVEVEEDEVGGSAGVALPLLESLPDLEDEGTRSDVVERLGEGRGLTDWTSLPMSEDELAFGVVSSIVRTSVSVQSHKRPSSPMIPVVGIERAKAVPVPFLGGRADALATLG